MPRHTLLIDADDTLWENNIFFEKTIEHFVTQLETLGYTREYIRHILNETERRNIRQHGYGVRSFRRSLEDTYLKLAGNSARREMVQEIERMAGELESTPPHILEGVPETLAYLSKHHRLILLTKGEAAEQAGKVERSGLQPYFDAIEIVHEKETGTYQRHGRAAQNRQNARLDGGQQPAQRHQSRPSGGPQRCLHSSLRHLGVGENRARKRHRKASDPLHFSRTSLPLLTSD